MAIEKKTTKKTAAKAAVKKPAAVKPVAVKPVAPKVVAPKTAVKKASASAKVAADKPAQAVAKKPVVSQERFYSMVSEAAYFSAQNDGNCKGAAEYWMDAEAAVRAKFDVA